MSDSEKKVPQETVSKALETLQNLAKGHSSRGTASTKVETMRDAGVGAGSGAGATQVFHTPSNSDPKSWAGSTARDVGEDGATDAIAENGTDYNGGAQMVKSVLSKLAKGQPLTAAEYELIKGKMSMDDDEKEMDKAFPPKAEDDDEDKDDAKKSLSDYAQSQEEVRKGLEMSSFLNGWVDVQNQALETTASRILTTVSKSLQAMSHEQNEFQSELAKGLVAMAEAMALQAQRIEQLESTPARGPKSQTVQPIEKSFAGPQGGEQINKAQVLDALVDMVQKGETSASEVVRFESMGTITPELERRVRAHIAKAR